MSSRCGRTTPRASARCSSGWSSRACCAARTAARRRLAAAATPAPRAAPTSPAALRGPRAATKPSSRGPQLERWCEQIAAAPLVALDTETTSLAYMRAELVGISLAVTPGRSGLYSARASLSRRAGPAESRGRARATQAMARERGAESRPSPEIRRAHLREPRHRASRHRARHDARVVRAELDGDAPRHGLRRGALPRRADAEVRGRRRQGREANHVRPGRSRHGDALLGRGRRHRAAAAPDAVAEARSGAGARTRLHRHRAAARARARADGVHGRHGRCARCCASRARSSPRRWPATEKAAHAAGGRAVQLGLAEAAAGSALRPAAPARARQDAEGPAVDGRGRARAARRKLRLAAARARVPRRSRS